MLFLLLLLGVVARQNLSKCFAEYDIDMLIEFLTSMKLCEILSPEMRNLTNLASVHKDDDETELLFFPALVRNVCRPEICIEGEGNNKEDREVPKISQKFKFGWCCHCTQPDIFIPRFLNLLTLRLAYKNVPPRSRDKPHCLKCTIWSKGILWKDVDGIQSLVELVDNDQSVILLMSSSVELEKKMVPVRSVIEDILCIKEECCLKLTTKEFVIESSCLKYPIDNLDGLILYDIEEIAHSVSNKTPYVKSYNKDSDDQFGNRKLSELFPLEHSRGQSMSIFVGRDISVSCKNIHSVSCK